MALANASASAASSLGPPAGYYATANNTSPETLRASLHEIIDDHVRVPYPHSSNLDTWDVLEVADQDPIDSSQILDVYRNASYEKFGGGNSLYNREHAWPKSFGFPDDLVSNYPYADVHALFLSNDSYNSSRGNKPYAACTAACGERSTEENHGIGGGLGIYPGNSNGTTGSGPTGTWETWSGRRGDVARALLYLDVRYEGGQHDRYGLHGFAERASPMARRGSRMGRLISPVTQSIAPRSGASRGCLSHRRCLTKPSTWIRR